MLQRRYSLGEIAKALKRSKSGIWHEVQKKHKERQYEADFANHVTYVRMRRSRVIGKKIAIDKELRSFIEKHLLDDQSPEEISKRLKRIEKNLPFASASAIRRYIKSPYGRRIEAHRAKIFKKKRGRRTTKPRIKNKRTIAQRPMKINKRWGLGHMEGDFIVSGRSGKGMILCLRDRKVRKNLLERILPVSAKETAKALLRMKKRYSEIQTITFDNDLLLLEHEKLEKKLEIKIYFCDLHAPWQKPSIENLNKVLRRYIPKSSDISRYSKNYIKRLELKMNRRFMDCLNSLTPDEAYEKERKQKQRRRTLLNKKDGRSN